MNLNKVVSVKSKWEGRKDEEVAGRKTDFQKG